MLFYLSSSLLLFLLIPFLISQGSKGKMALDDDEYYFYCVILYSDSYYFYWYCYSICHHYCCWFCLFLASFLTVQNVKWHKMMNITIIVLILIVILFYYYWYCYSIIIVVVFAYFLPYSSRSSFLSQYPIPLLVSWGILCTTHDIGRCGWQPLD